MDDNTHASLSLPLRALSPSPARAVKLERRPDLSFASARALSPSLSPSFSLSHRRPTSTLRLSPAPPRPLASTYHLPLGQVLAGHAADADRPELAVLRVDRHRAAEALVPGLPPLRHERSVAQLLLDAVVVDLLGDHFVPLVHVPDVARALPVDLVDRPDRLALALALVVLVNFWMGREKGQCGVRAKVLAAGDGRGMTAAAAVSEGQRVGMGRLDVGAWREA